MSQTVDKCKRRKTDHFSQLRKTFFHLLPFHLHFYMLRREQPCRFGVFDRKKSFKRKFIVVEHRMRATRSTHTQAERESERVQQSRCICDGRRKRSIKWDEKHQNRLKFAKYWLFVFFHIKHKRIEYFNLSFCQRQCETEEQTTKLKQNALHKKAISIDSTPC